MGKPYSMDLRERVVEAVERGGLSRRRAAARFGVSYSTAIGWLKRYREKGHAEPGQMGGHRPKKITGADREWLVERCRDADFTLRGLVCQFALNRAPCIASNADPFCRGRTGLIHMGA